MDAQADKRRIDQSAVSKKPPVPVIVVGNISVGGTGKSPVIMALVDWLKAEGFKPGVVARGYGGKAESYPHVVAANDDASVCGDEPLMIKLSCDVPVVVGADRAAVAMCVYEQGANVILSDDGLQHYRLGRDIEWVLIDGQRMFGNGHGLPAGPLREPVSRLNEVQQVLVNGEPSKALPSHLDYQCFKVNPFSVRRLGKAESYSLAEWKSVIGTYQVHAVAGIANPQRFINSLESMDLKPDLRALPDHHQFTASDLEFDDDLPVVITEKDAVKCQSFESKPIWVLQVRANLPASVLDRLRSQLAELTD